MLDAFPMAARRSGPSLLDGNTLRSCIGAQLRSEVDRRGAVRDGVVEGAGHVPV